MGGRFGVPAVDRALGDIPRGGLVLLRHDPTLDAAPFTVQAAAAQLGAAVDVVYLVTNRSPARTREALAELGAPHDLSGLRFVDAHSSLMAAPTDAAYPVADPTDLGQVAARLEQAAKEHPDAVLLADSLSGLLDHADEARFLEKLPRLEAALRRFRFAAVVWTAWPYSEDVENALARFDAVITLRGVEERVVLHQTLAVERSRWGKTAPPVLYKVEASGVLVYVPKVIVVGPHDAGKTTFVHSLSGSALSVDRLGTTVAMDRGTVTLDGIKVEVFGTPGQPRFDPLLPTLAGQAVAAILLVDATRPETFGRGKEMLQKVWRRGLRALIALTKSDLPGALSVAEASRRLTPPPGVEVVACDATDAESVRQVLRRMVDDVLSSGSGAGAAGSAGGAA
jgi:small GTP-binding protein